MKSSPRTEYVRAVRAREDNVSPRVGLLYFMTKLIKKKEYLADIPVRNEVTKESFSGLLLLKITTKVIRGSTRVKKYVL